MKNNKLSSYANLNVLKFYEELPFNYYSSVEKHADKIKNGETNLEIYGPLLKEIQNSENIIDIGCGAGYLVNTISFLYPKKKVVGLDFNKIAIDRAEEVSKYLKLNSSFNVDDIFKYFPVRKFDLATSIGVLMHTNDCFEGLKFIIENIINKKGKIYIGLYNKYGRKPFLEYFEKLKQKKISENEIFDKYAELHTNLKDKTHLKSWFRDQVLHPHETQFSIRDIVNFLNELDFRVSYTSINKFEKIKFDNNGYNKKQIEQIYLEEIEMENKANKALIDKRYYPGFFTFLAERK